MNRLTAALLLVLGASAAHATEVVDDFESGTNPNQWGWTNGGGGNFTIQPDGGNPGAWLDSGVPYFSDHPNLTSFPPDGTALRDALASGALVSASADIERLDTAGVTGCGPVYDLPSNFTLQLSDIHTIPSDPPTVIEAHTTDGPVSPLEGPFPWMTVTFAIPSDSTDVPPGWVLNAPPELNYTWQDLMHNIDGISFFVVNPEEITFDSCWHLGGDNIVIGYGDAGTDTVFVDGFDGAPGRMPLAR
ncbi:MAG TPA: hypothetical protein VKB52_17245 [Rhodanobacteraceae bacterium]|nr:hypothetical protein [Rhodanobacteraceae bacterium]